MLNMRKVIVIGCPGSGKSTFSKKLNKITGIPLFHLDMLYWNADKTTVDKSVFMDKLSAILEKDSWIIDGNYASTMEMRMNMCDTVIFLDFQTDVCINGITERKGKPRSDIPWFESDTIDTEFIEFVENFNLKSRPQVLDLLDKYSHKEIHIFTDRDQADKFLSELI